MGAEYIEYDISDNCDNKNCHGKVRKFYAQIYRCTTCGEYKYMYTPEHKYNRLTIDKRCKNVAR